MLSQSSTKEENMNFKHSFLKGLINFKIIKRSISDFPQAKAQEENNKSSKQIKLIANELKHKNKLFNIRRSISEPEKQHKKDLTANLDVSTTKVQNKHEKTDNKKESIKINIKKPKHSIPLIKNDVMKPKSNKNSSIENETKKPIEVTRYSKEKANKLQIEIKRKKESQISPMFNFQDLEMMNEPYNIVMPVENEPICIAIGDIEGDIDKLRLICDFIKTNPQLDFVFIGDIIDDISDGKQSKVNWECISLICKEFLPDDTTYKSDDNSQFNGYESNMTKSKIVSLPSGFKDIEFKEKKYEDIKSRVKFIAGNSECECLSDFQKEYKRKNDKYIFIQKKWKKTVTFEQMCLIHRYLSNCSGVITLNTNKANPNPNNRFCKTVYFRHFIEKFRRPYIAKYLHQKTHITLNDIRQQNFIFITGHNSLFASGGPEEVDNQEMYYFIDSTSFKHNQGDEIEFPKEIRGLGSNDNRLALISFSEETGFYVEGITLPFNIE